MRLGETIATYDVALALRGERGKFEVTRPTGESFQLTCKLDESISSLEWSGNSIEAQPFLIRKIAEPVTHRNGVPSSGGIVVNGENPIRPATTPFLIENPDDAANSLAPQNEVSSMKAPGKFSGSGESILELEFQDNDLKTQQPLTCIYFRSGFDHEAERRPLTPACETYNQLDSEIRKLQAQLDEIRCRAKRYFYRIQTTAPGA